MDPDAACAAFTGFNRWLEEDWGFAFENRLFAAPYISLMNPEWAEKELESLLERGARLISMVPGPIPVGDESMSIADPGFDGFWARVSEAGIPVAFHAGDSGYRKFTVEAWGGTREFRAFAFDPIITCLSPEPIQDTFAAMICHGLFDRHPGVRVASIECGSSWMIDLARRFKKAYGQMPMSFTRDPMDTLREHCSIAPYYEDDIVALRDIIGSENILFGSDFPHAEGLADPISFLSEIEDFSETDVRKVMGENAYSLLDAN